MTISVASVAGRRSDLGLVFGALVVGAIGSALLIPQGDVTLYHRYGLDLLHGHGSSRLPLEYPAMSAVVFAVPLLLPFDYRVAFTLTMAGALGVLAAVGVRFCGRAWSARLGWYLALGTVGVLFSRYDLVPAVAMLVAVHASTERHWSRAWLAAVVGGALKVFPLLLLPGFLIAEWRESGRPPWRRLLVFGLSVGLAAVLQDAVVPGSLITPLRYEWHRGFEFSSVAGSLTALFDPLHLHWRAAFGAVEVVGSAHRQIAGLVALCEVACLGGAWVAAWCQRLATTDVALVVLSVAVLADRAFAPQYLVWLAPLWALYPLRRLWLVAAVLTTVTYPFAFAVGLLHFGSLLPATGAAVVRNGVLIAATVSWLSERLTLTSPLRCTVRISAAPLQSRPGGLVNAVGGPDVGPRLKEERSFAHDGH